MSTSRTWLPVLATVATLTACTQMVSAPRPADPGPADPTTRATITGVAVAPLDQLKTVAPLTTVAPVAPGDSDSLTTVAPLKTVAPFRIQDAPPPHAYVPGATISVLTTRFEPLAALPLTRTDASGSFRLEIPAGRPLFLNVDYGTVKRLCLFAYVKADPGSTRRIHVNVPTTLAATLMKNRFKDAPGIERLDWDLMSQLTERIPLDTIPDLSSEGDVLAHSQAITTRTPLLAALLSTLETLLNR